MYKIRTAFPTGFAVAQAEWTTSERPRSRGDGRAQAEIDILRLEDIYNSKKGTIRRTCLAIFLLNIVFVCHCMKDDLASSLTNVSGYVYAIVPSSSYSNYICQRTDAPLLEVDLSQLDMTSSSPQRDAVAEECRMHLIGG